MNSIIMTPPSPPHPPVWCLNTKEPEQMALVYFVFVCVSECKTGVEVAGVGMNVSIFF